MAQAALCDITPQTRIPTLLIVFCVHVLLLVGRCEFRPNPFLVGTPLPRPFLDPFLATNPPPSWPGTPLPMTLPAPQRQPVLAMSACPFAWDWMAAVTGPAGTRGCSLPEGHTFHDTAIATNSAVTWPPGTSIGRVRITKSILRDRDPCALSDLIAETVRRNPEIAAFHVRPSGADYSSLVESLSTRLPSDHARIRSHYMAAHPVDAEPPTTLRFASTKPKPATFAKEGWHKEAAKRKLFLFDPRQSGEETLPIYSLSSRSAWEWDGDSPGLTFPSAYAASGLLALPITSTPFCRARGSAVGVAESAPHCREQRPQSACRPAALVHPEFFCGV